MEERLKTKQTSNERQRAENQVRSQKSNQATQLQRKRELQQMRSFVLMNLHLLLHQRSRQELSNICGYRAEHHAGQALTTPSTRRPSKDIGCGIVKGFTIVGEGQWQRRVNADRRLFGQAAHDALYGWCVMELYSWHLHDGINQCHPNKCDKIKKTQMSTSPCSREEWRGVRRLEPSENVCKRHHVGCSSNQSTVCLGRRFHFHWKEPSQTGHLNESSVYLWSSERVWWEKIGYGFLIVKHIFNVIFRIHCYGKYADTYLITEGKYLGGKVGWSWTWNMNINLGHRQRQRLLRVLEAWEPSRLTNVCMCVHTCGFPYFFSTFSLKQLGWSQRQKECYICPRSSIPFIRKKNTSHRNSSFCSCLTWRVSE